MSNTKVRLHGSQQRWRVVRGLGIVVAVAAFTLCLQATTFAAGRANSGSSTIGAGGQRAAQVTLSGAAAPGAKVTPDIALNSNPYGCYSRSDNPHESGHNPGYVSAIGNTICTVALPYVHADATLYRQDCFLFICWWTQVGYDSQTRSGVTSARAIPNHQCSDSSNHLYEIDTYSAVQDAAGNYYDAYTSKQATVACG